MCRGIGMALTPYGSGGLCLGPSRRYARGSGFSSGRPRPAYPTTKRESLDATGITSPSKIRTDITFTAGNRLVTHGLPNLAE